MSDQSKKSALPITLRVIGSVVILASVAAAILAVMLAFSSGLFHSRSAEGLFIQSLIASFLVSGIGGLWMFFATKNPWWLLAFLPVFGGIGVWLLFAMMVPVTFH